MSTITTATEISGGGGGGGAPTGAAGGDLGGTYPNPTVDNDSHTHTSATVTLAAADVGAAPSTPDYLVGTASGALSAEIAVGTTPGGELGGTWASPTVDATHSGSTHAATQVAAESTAAGALAAHEADTTAIHGITDTSALYAAGGTDVAVADGGTGASTASAARTNLGLGTAAVSATGDFDAAGAAAAAQAASQPLDSDLTAIAALATTSYGRAFLALADAAAGRTALGLGTAALSASGDFDAAGAAAAAQAASQPLDSDLTAIAALTTTSFGRSVLAAANAAALATLAGVGTGDSPQVAALNVGHASDTTITRTGAGDIAVEGNALYRAGGPDVPVTDGGTGASSASAARTNLGLVIGTNVQAQDAELAALAGLVSAADSVPYFTGSGTASLLVIVSAIRTILAAADASAFRAAAGLAIGTDVEAHDADLTTIAGLSPANDDVLQRKAGAWANRTIAQLLTDLAAAGTTFQPLDADLTALAALSTTSFGRSVLEAANAAALRTLAGLGTAALSALGDFDPAGAASAAQAASQPLDGELTAIAGLTSAADRLPYFTGSAAAAVATFTAAGRALIDDADAAAQRTTLGLGSLATASSLAHSATTGITANDHHNQSHDHSAAGDGSTVRPASLVLPNLAGSPTVLGDFGLSGATILIVGTGGGSQYFLPIDGTPPVTQAFGDAAATGSANAAAFRDHRHGMPWAWPIDPTNNVTIATATYVEQWQEIRLSSSYRLTMAGTGRLNLLDNGTVASVIVGTPRTPPVSFTVPTEYVHDLLARLSLTGQVRATLQGTADLWIVDDFKQRQRIVLS